MPYNTRVFGFELHLAEIKCHRNVSADKLCGVTGFKLTKAVMVAPP